MIKMPLGMEVGLGPGDFVLGWDPAPPRQNGRGHSPQFSTYVYCGQTLDGSRCHLVRTSASAQATLC